MSSRLITLHGPHPYVPDADGGLRVELLEAVPGEAESLRDMRRSMSGSLSREGVAWVPLAGPYRISPGRYAAPGREWKKSEMVYGPCAAQESAALLALLWDLNGCPICVGGPRRRAATIAVVESHEGITVYRDARECLSSEDGRQLKRGEAA